MAACKVSTTAISWLEYFHKNWGPNPRPSSKVAKVHPETWYGTHAAVGRWHSRPFSSLPWRRHREDRHSPPLSKRTPEVPIF
jgi:hypothetical protein